MKKLSCEQTEELVVRELDEGLDPGKRTSLEAHLHDCQRCRSFAQEMAETFDRVASAKPLDPDEDFWKRYHSTLDAKLTEARMERDRRIPWGKIAGLVAACLLVAVAALQYSGSIEPERPAQHAQSVVLLETLESALGPVDDMSGMRSATGASEPSELSEEVGIPADALVMWFETEDESDHLFL